MLDPALASQLRHADSEQIGARLREARISAGLSQGEVAAGEVTISFISRIETGKRRADPALIARLAERVGLSVESLLITEDEPEFAPYVPALQFAEAALELGERDTALGHLDSLVGLVPPIPTSVERRVTVLRAALDEADGETARAIERLEPMLQEDLSPLLHVQAATVLARCYARAGQQVRSVRVGETALAELEERALRGTDAAVQLAMVVAEAYAAQGDRDYAVRLVRRVLNDAEQLSNLRTRARAFWKAAVLEQAHGEVPTAVVLARRAVELLHRERDSAHLARLRSQLGQMELMLDPPAVDDATSHLRAADAELRALGSASAEVIQHDLALARLSIVTGDADHAVEITRTLRESDHGPEVAVESWRLEGEAQLALGDRDAARSALSTAADRLAEVPVDRATGQTWMDLAGLLGEVGEDGWARDAYRRAALAAGLGEERRAGSTAS